MAGARTVGRVESGQLEKFEFVEIRRPKCRKCRTNPVTIRLLRVAGGRDAVCTWVLCEGCSPPHFFLPENAEEAYARWQEKKNRKAGEVVIDTFTPQRT